MPPNIKFPLPFQPGLDLGKLGDILKNFDPAKCTGGLLQGLQQLIQGANGLLGAIGGAAVGAGGAQGAGDPRVPAASQGAGGTQQAGGAQGGKAPSAVDMENEEAKDA